VTAPLVVPDSEIRAHGHSLGRVSWQSWPSTISEPAQMHLSPIQGWVRDPTGAHETWVYRVATFTIPYLEES
jgi:hypothetical protein